MELSVEGNMSVEMRIRLLYFLHHLFFLKTLCIATHSTNEKWKLLFWEESPQSLKIVCF